MGACGLDKKKALLTKCFLLAKDCDFNKIDVIVHDAP